MISVTVQSSALGQYVTVPFASIDNLPLARQLAAAISSEVASGGVRSIVSGNRPPPRLSECETGVFFQETSGLTYLPRGYDAVVDIAKAATIFGSGGDRESVLSGNGGLTFVASRGSGTVVAGGGNNDIRITSHDRGAWLIATGGDNDTITAAGKGNDTIRPGAGQNTVFLENGNKFLQLTGQDTVTVSTGHATIDASGAISSRIDGVTSSILFVGGSGVATIEGGRGSDTVYGGTGQLSVRGGTGGGNLLFGGIGAATLVGGGSGDQLYAQGKLTQILIAGNGNETLSAAQSSGNVSLVGGSGRDLMIGGSGADTFVAGAGKATMQGGAGADVFAFVNGSAGGKDLILDFGETDRILLSGYGPHAVATALASESVSHGSVTITLQDDTKITFSAVTSLKSSNFA